MFKSIEETTARLKSLDFSVRLDTNFSTSPLSIRFNSELILLRKGITTLPLTISSINQIFKIEFFGYVPHDKDQKIIIDIYHENIKLDTTSLCTFQMKNNQHVENINIKDYNKICFNGALNLKFFKSWFECNILNGANLYNDNNILIQWRTTYNNIKIKNSDTFCIGDSFTVGDGVEEQHTWPALLRAKTNTSNINLGVNGLSTDGCFANIQYILNNFDPKTIICLLPTRFRKIYRFNFLNYFGYVSLGVFSNLKLPKIYINDIEKFKKTNLLDDTITKNLWIISCENIIKSCQKKMSSVLFLPTNKICMSIFRRMFVYQYFQN